MGFAPTWLRQVSPPPASQNHFNHCERWVKVHCMIVALGMFQAVSAAAAGASRNKNTTKRKQQQRWFTVYSVDAYNRAQAERCWAKTRILDVKRSITWFPSEVGVHVFHA